MAAFKFWKIFHCRLKPRPAQANFQFPLEIPRQASFKPHRLLGQEIVQSKARRQAEIYIKEKDGTTKFIASLEGKRLNSKKEKSPKFVSAEMTA